MPDSPLSISYEIESKVCPRCSQKVDGNFCGNCGERLSINREDLSLKNFAREAYHELFDLDSKFLRTLKYLFLRPGFLTVEWLNGSRNLYIKPLRLYISLVVIHFLLFSAIPSGDIFNVDRFPAIKFSPLLQEVLHESEITHAESLARFKNDLNTKVKDNLSIALYLVVFIVAIVLKVLFSGSRRYYIEHLNFVFHVFSFAFARNVLIIPLIVMDLIPLTIVLVIGTQMLYTIAAMQNVYKQGILISTGKFFLVLVTVGALFYLALHVSVFAALEQVS